MCYYYLYSGNQELNYLKSESFYKYELNIIRENRFIMILNIKC